MLMLACHGGVMTKITTLALLLTLTGISGARAEDNLIGCAVWMEANAKMLARWQRSEPRCGWTVGGNTCVSCKHASNRSGAVR
jgi:hypothetical protein